MQILQIGIKPLVQWRLRKGLTPRGADILLARPPGAVEKYEELGLTRIPIDKLGRMIALYGVSQDELDAALTDRLRH